MQWWHVYDCNVAMRVCKYIHIAEFRVTLRVALLTSLTIGAAMRYPCPWVRVCRWDDGDKLSNGIEDGVGGGRCPIGGADARQYMVGAVL